MRICAKGPWLAAIVVGLAACTTTYGPENPPEEEPVSDEAPCEIGDTRPGCSAEDTACMNPHDYLCEGP